MSLKTTHPVVRAAIGIAALVLIAVFANLLISLTSIGNHGKDFTQNQVHTLSDGTRSILKELRLPQRHLHAGGSQTPHAPRG